MSLGENVIEGTLKPDGTLQLDRKPTVSPGRVTVTVQPASASQPAPEGWWPYMQRIRANREAAGYHFMNEHEMQVHLDWLRDDEDRLERIHREIPADCGPSPMPANS